VVKLERIGDLVLSIPAIHSIKKKFPESKLTIIVNSYTQEVIKNDPNIDSVIVYNRNISVRDKIKFIKALRNERFDLAIDLTTRDFFFLPALIIYLTNAKIKIGLDNLGRGFLFDVRVNPPPNPMHLSQEVLNIVSSLGIEAEEIRPKLFVSNNDREYIKRFLKELDVREDRLLVVIHPGGHFKTQRWKEDGYAGVSDYLIKRYGACVFFIGDERDKEVMRRILSLTEEKPFDLVGKLSLGKVMALISVSHLFIGNNSGPLHIATALSIPTISFLGPTPEERWHPLGDRNIVFKKDLPCIPCELGYCLRNDFGCMQEIGVQEVIEAIDSIFSKE